MTDVPPRLPSGPPDMPPAEEKQDRTFLIGLLAALIAVLLFMLVLTFALGRSPKTTQGTDQAGEASVQGSEDVKASGDETKQPLSPADNSTSAQTDDPSTDPEEAASVSESSTTREEAESNNSATRSTEAPISQPPGRNSDTKVDRAIEPATAASTTATAENSTQREDAIQNRTRRLNIRNGFVPLVSGEGNPLRVGSEVKSIVYVIDKSSSMAGDPLRKVVIALCDAVDALNEKQEYAVILFDTQSHPLGRLELQSASEADKDETKQALSEISGTGGTSPFEAVQDALDLKPDAIVLLSDGDFGQFDVIQITQYNHSRKPVTTIHCVGLRRDIRTLRQLSSDNGNGAYTTVELLRSP